jgi:hypothetical protein
VIVVCDDREADGLEDIRVDDEEVNVGKTLREGELETREDEELLTERVGEDDLRADIEASADREGEVDIDAETETADERVAEFESLLRADDERVTTAVWESEGSDDSEGVVEGEVDERELFDDDVDKLNSAVLDWDTNEVFVTVSKDVNVMVVLGEVDCETQADDDSDVREEAVSEGDKDGLPDALVLIDSDARPVKVSEERGLCEALDDLKEDRESDGREVDDLLSNVLREGRDDALGDKEVRPEFEVVTEKDGSELVLGKWDVIGEVESLTDENGEAVEDGDLTEEEDIRPDWLFEEEDDGWLDSVFDLVSITVAEDEVDTDIVVEGELVAEGLAEGDFDVCTDCVFVIVSTRDWEIKPEDVSELDTLADAVNDMRDVPDFDSKFDGESLWIEDGDIEDIALSDNDPLNEALLLIDMSEDCVYVTRGEKLNVDIVVEDVDTTAVIESLGNGEVEDDSSELPDGDPLTNEVILKVDSGVCVLVVYGEILIVVSEVKEWDTRAEGESDVIDDGEDDSSALLDGESLNEELPLIDASDDCVIETSGVLLIVQIDEGEIDIRVDGESLWIDDGEIVENTLIVAVSLNEELLLKDASGVCVFVESTLLVIDKVGFGEADIEGVFEMNALTETLADDDTETAGENDSREVSERDESGDCDDESWGVCVIVWIAEVACGDADIDDETVEIIEEAGELLSDGELVEDKETAGVSLLLEESDADADNEGEGGGGGSGSAVFEEDVLLVWDDEPETDDEEVWLGDSEEEIDGECVSSRFVLEKRGLDEDTDVILAEPVSVCAGDKEGEDVAVAEGDDVADVEALSVDVGDIVDDADCVDEAVELALIDEDADAVVDAVSDPMAVQLAVVEALEVPLAEAVDERVSLALWEELADEDDDWVEEAEDVAVAVIEVDPVTLVLEVLDSIAAWVKLELPLALVLGNGLLLSTAL